MLYPKKKCKFLRENLRRIVEGLRFTPVITTRTTMTTTRICKGLYQTEWNGHIIQISNEAEWVGPGSLTWAILSDTLDLDANEGMWDTLYATKREALERLPEILKTSIPYEA
jgi:hypothetical protein